MAQSESQNSDNRTTGGDRVQPILPINGDELETILFRAETLLEASREAQRHAENIAIGLVSLTLAVTASVASLVASFVYDRSVFAIPTLITLTATLVGVHRTLRRRNLASYDSKNRMEAAVELAALVDETYIAVSALERWSFVRVEATRIRLYMFPLAHRYDVD